jgi:hypothetical protein
MRRRVRSVAYRERRYGLKAARRARRQALKDRLQLRSFESSLMRSMFGSGGEPSWNDIRAAARAKFNNPEGRGVLKPLRGDFTT